MNKLSGMVALCALLAGAGTALGDDRVATADTAAPAPEAARKLARLVGTWKASGRVKIGKTTAPVAGTWTCKAVSAGLGVSCALALKGIPGIALYEEVDLFGYDPGDGLVHWYSVTSAGETHDHKGSWNGDTLQVTFTGPKGGHLLTERITLVVDRERLRVSTVVFEGHKRGPSFEMTATR